MNKTFRNILIAMGMVGMLTSCFDELDDKPLGEQVTKAEDAYKTPAEYRQGLAKVYATFAVSGQQGPAGQPDVSGIDEGFGNYLRQYWNCQELTTDEAVIGWNDATIKDFHWHTWTPTDVFISAMYSRAIYTVTIANDFIKASAQQTDPEVQRYNAEARFLRALAYYHALDLFGNPPFVTELDEPGLWFPKQTTRAELYDYIESELLAIEEVLGDPGFEYARADKGALWMLLSKLYLNSEVYVKENRYTDALTYLNKLISSAAYSLSANYRHNFVADNNTSPEMIFPVTFDGANTQSYGGMVYLIHAAIGGKMSAKDMFGVGSGWGGTRTTSALVEKFEDPSGEADSRALFWTVEQTLEINDIGNFGDGYAVTKFRNRKLDGSDATHPHADFVDTDYPLFRLADAYLMYAEAVLRGGTGGTRAQALTLVNEIRERAYGDASGNISDASLTLEFILDERARELYWEGHRRTDLIRYGLFTGSGYLWPWKGNQKEGAPSDSYRNLFPIPATDLSANPNLVQNPGY